jgi:lipopolysaccharide export system permease protein
VIFQRALLRELSNTAAAIVAALFAIMLTTNIVRLLSRAAGGKIPLDTVLAVLGFTAIRTLPVLLALTLFVAVLMTLSRSYRDSEMVIWNASGLSLAAWIKPVLTFAAPVIALVTVMSLFLTPWASERAEEYRRQIDNRDEVSRIAPGVFRESSNAERVFFVEGVDGDQAQVQNIFIATRKSGQSGVVVSRTGFIETAENGDRFAVLLNGRRYEGVPGTPEYRVMEFERYAARIEARGGRDLDASPRAMSTAQLLEPQESRQAENKLKAELLWRIGLPLMALNLALLAVPLSFVNPRATRSINLLFAVFAYLVYSNLLGVVQAWVAQGRLRFEIGWWLLHAIMLAAIALLFLKRTTLRFGLGRLFAR